MTQLPSHVTASTGFPPATVHRNGFTLLELLVALVILVAAMSIVWATFSSTTRAWQRGTELANQLHHGDFVMEQLTEALRSAAFFQSNPELYEFRLENRSGAVYPADIISWVTSSPAFMPVDSPWAHGMHRIVATVERDRGGDHGFAVRAYYHLEDRDDLDDDPQIVSPRVHGIRFNVFDFEREEWVEQWAETNSIPERVMVTLYLDSGNNENTPTRVTRVIDIPVASVVTQRLELVEDELR